MVSMKKYSCWGKKSWFKYLQNRYVVYVENGSTLADQSNFFLTSISLLENNFQDK